MSVQSVYLINRGGGEWRNQRILVVSKYDLPDPPPDSVIFLWSSPPLSLVPSLYSVGGVWSPLYSLPPEKYVILPKSFSPPPPSASYKLWLVRRRRQRDIITKNKGFLITLAQKKKEKKIDSPVAELKVHNVSQVCHLGCTKTVEP